MHYDGTFRCLLSMMYFLHKFDDSVCFRDETFSMSIAHFAKYLSGSHMYAFKISYRLRNNPNVLKFIGFWFKLESVLLWLMILP